MIKYLYKILLLFFIATMGLYSQWDKDWYHGWFIIDGTPPSAPTSLAAVGGVEEVVFTWDANTESDLAGYIFYGGTSTDPTDSVAFITAGTETYTWTGRTEGTIYFGRLKARDAVYNYSAYSDNASDTAMYNWSITLTSSANPTITMQGIGIITIDWGDSTTSNHTLIGSDVAVSHTYTYNLVRNVIIYNATRITKFLTTSNCNWSFTMESLPRRLTYYYNYGSNTTSGSISSLPTGLTYYYNYGSNTTSGSISSLPTGLTYYYNSGSNTTSGSISSLPTGLTYYYNSGSNTTSGLISSLPTGLTYYYNYGLNTTSGSISSLPTGLITYLNSGSNTTSGLISALPDGLTYYYNSGSNTTSGLISALPAGLTYYYNTGSNTVADYTAGRTWANNQQYFLSLPTVGNGLSSTEVDNLLIDLANVVTWTGNKVINIAGNNAARTSASDAAKATLLGKGVTVTVNE